MQNAVSGLAAVYSALCEWPPPGAVVATALTIPGVISGAIAYAGHIFAQAHTSPAEAALILALDGLFAALAGALLLGECLTAIGALGRALILAGALASEIGPLFARQAASGAT